MQVASHLAALAAPPLLGSVVIPAHNEAAGIHRCLDALFTGTEHGELDVVVRRQRGTGLLVRPSLRVIELETPSKPAVLRPGDKAAQVLPRLYLDADAVLYGSAARDVMERLRVGAVAPRPPIRYDSSGSSLPGGSR